MYNTIINYKSNSIIFVLSNEEALIQLITFVLFTVVRKPIILKLCIIKVSTYTTMTTIIAFRRLIKFTQLDFPSTI